MIQIANDKDAPSAEKAMATRDPIFTGKVKNGAWVFSNSKGDTINMVDGTSKMPTSNQVFGADASGPFFGENHTVKCIIGREMLSALNVALLPNPPKNVKVTINGQVKTTSVLCKPYFESSVVHSKFWQPGPKLTALGNGPYYNVYQKTLHKIAKKIYAFAYDDALGMDSTIQVSSPENSPQTGKIIIGDLNGLVVPKSDKNKADHWIGIGIAKGSTVSSIETFDGTYKQLPAPPATLHVKNEFTMKLSGKGAGDYKININERTYGGLKNVAEEMPPSHPVQWSSNTDVYLGIGTQ